MNAYLARANAPLESPLATRLLRSLGYRVRRIAERVDAAAMNRELRRSGVNLASRVATWTTKRELDALFRLARSSPERAAGLEIGSYVGASSRFLAAGLALVGGRLACVDTWRNNTIPGDDRDTFDEFRRNIAGLAQIITPIRKRSEELSTNDLPEHLNLVFLDGDHSYAAVSREFALVSPRVIEGGIVAFHDAIAFAGVAKTIGGALESGGWQFGGNVDNLIWLRRLSHWNEPAYNEPSCVES